MALKTWAKGTIIRLNGAAIASVKDIKGPNQTRKTIDMTTHDSPNDYEEYTATMRSAGELTFGLVWDPSTATHGTPTNGLLWQFQTSGSPGSWDLMFPLSGSPGFTWSGDVTAFGGSAPVADGLTADVTVKVNSKPVYRAAIT